MLGARENTTIVCTCPSGQGVTRQAKIVDYVPTKIFSDFVFTPIPRYDSEDKFFEARKKLSSQQSFPLKSHLFDDYFLEEFDKTIDRIKENDKIEFWIDPSLNGQISAFRLLTIFDSIPDIKNKLYVNHLEQPSGLMNVDMVKEAQSNSIPATKDLFEQANVYWNAFKSPTPEAWHNLENGNHSMFPYIKKVAWQLLLELPAKSNSLRLLDMRILKYLEKGPMKTRNIIGHILGNELDGIKMLNDYVIAEAIYNLAIQPIPAIVGIPSDIFDYYCTDDNDYEKRTNFLESEPKLTAFGGLLLEERADFAEHNNINFWWGGTHITNDNLWRFDSRTGELFAPQ